MLRIDEDNMREEKVKHMKTIGFLKSKIKSKILNFESTKTNLPGSTYF
jgi:hypothetical protein